MRGLETMLPTSRTISLLGTEDLTLSPVIFELSVGLLGNQSLVLEYFLLVFSRSSFVTRFYSILHLSMIKCGRHEHGMRKHVILQRVAKFVF